MIPSIFFNSYYKPPKRQKIDVDIKDILDEYYDIIYPFVPKNELLKFRTASKYINNTISKFLKLTTFNDVCPDVIFGICSYIPIQYLHNRRYRLISSKFNEGIDKLEMELRCHKTFNKKRKDDLGLYLNVLTAIQSKCPCSISNFIRTLSSHCDGCKCVNICLCKLTRCANCAQKFCLACVYTRLNFCKSCGEVYCLNCLIRCPLCNDFSCNKCFLNVKNVRMWCLKCNPQVKNAILDRDNHH